MKTKRNENKKKWKQEEIRNPKVSLEKRGFFKYGVKKFHFPEMSEDFFELSILHVRKNVFRKYKFLEA